MPYIKQTDYIAAIQEANGLISVAARRLGCSRQAIYDAARKHKKVQVAIDDARERTTDLAESQLFQQINEGNTTAIIFYLKTQAKQRGYVERQELDTTVRGDIVIDLVNAPHADSDS